MSSKIEETTNSKIQARVTHRFNAPAERVFDGWLQPESVRQWMKAALMEMGLAGEIRQVRVDARVGGSFFFSDMRDGQEARHWGKYIEFDRPRRLVFTWITDESEESDPSKVTLTIDSEGSGCVATIVHEMDKAWAEYVARTEKGWVLMLGAIASLVALSRK
jgi:uncharacterized protein YndB with AHSA1/START domain